MELSVKKKSTGADSVGNSGVKNGKKNKSIPELVTDYVARVKSGAKYISQTVKEDVAAVRQRDPAARSNAEVLLLYSGVHALIAHRVAHGLHKNGHYFVARAISQTAKMITGVEIHPGATIGKGLVIDHGTGVVIGETAEIGDNCTIYQGVTLGGTGKYSAASIEEKRILKCRYKIVNILAERNKVINIEVFGLLNKIEAILLIKVIKIETCTSEMNRIKIHRNQLGQ